MMMKIESRPLALFELFAEMKRPLSLTEVARGLGAPVSTCFNLLRSMESVGFLYNVGGRRHVYPTRKIYDLASVIVAHEPWAERFGPKLEELRDLTGETAILGTWQGNKVVYLAVLEGPKTIRYTAQAGDLKPLHSSAIGKALLTRLDPERRAQLVEGLTLESRTPATITDRPALLADLDRAARDGFTTTRGENVADVMAIAMPLKLDGSDYAIAVAGPMQRMQADIEIHRRHLGDICAQIGGGK
jgi:DNA-binding IclR family transcriptional regulator